MALAPVPVGPELRSGSPDPSASRHSSVAPSTVEETLNANSLWQSDWSLSTAQQARPRELQRRHGMRKAGHRRDQRRSHRSRLRARAVLRHPDRLILKPGPYRVTCGGR